MKLIVGPRHRFAQSNDAIEAIASNDEILIVREPGSGSREVVTQALGLHAIEPKQTLEIGSTEAIKQAVAAGLGVSAVAISDQLRRGGDDWTKGYPWIVEIAL